LLEGAAEDKLTGVQDERLTLDNFEATRQVGLFLCGVNERVLVVVEQAEELVQPNIDARGLNHPKVEWVKLYAARFELCADIAVTEKHEISLSGSIGFTSSSSRSIFRERIPARLLGPSSGEAGLLN
jgi:hypothetical protein